MGGASASAGGGGMGGGMAGAVRPAANSMSAGGDSQPLTYIPLAMVAKITREVGANEIASENGRLRAYVQANVQDRDLGGFVKEVEQALKTT
jgi:Cu(I)/Ag(I) efflux system membrane protein CusA/SilA